MEQIYCKHTLEICKGYFITTTLSFLFFVIVISAFIICQNISKINIGILQIPTTSFPDGSIVLCTI